MEVFKSCETGEFRFLVNSFAKPDSQDDFEILERIKVWEEITQHVSMFNESKILQMHPILSRIEPYRSLTLA
jgi:hypothetical protein